MKLDGRTLVVVADGRRARLFEEARRGGPLTERAEWLQGLAFPHVAHPGPRGGVHDRMGHAAHATAHESGRDKGETRFLADLAGRLEPIVEAHAFDELVLIAAPRALGVLRTRLPTGLRARVECSEPHDRLAAGADEIREVLRALRRKSA